MSPRIRFGQKKSELRAGAAAVRSRLPASIFKIDWIVSSIAVGVGQRALRRRDVVEDEGAFVERRQIIGADIADRPKYHGDRGERGDRPPALAP